MAAKNREHVSRKGVVFVPRNGAALAEWGRREKLGVLAVFRLFICVRCHHN